MINTPYKTLPKGSNDMHPGVQFLLFIAVFIVVLIICSLIGAGIATALYGEKAVLDIALSKTSSPNAAHVLWILQLTGTTFPIFAAPVFYAWVVARDPQEYLKPTFRFPWLLVVLVFAIMLFSNPLIELLAVINQKMVLPHWLQWMKDSEESAQKLMETMLQMKTIGDLVLDVFLVGLLTAIVEELMFRGVLQTIFVKWTKSVHAAVWITAILFSAFHVEFFGFLPRMILGVMLGYFVAWSGSIWPAVWGHFINNATAVIATYLFQHKIIKDNPDDQRLFGFTGYAVSLVVVLLLFYQYKKTAMANMPLPLVVEAQTDEYTDPPHESAEDR